ncbi:MAG: DUF4388 domain-containing protein [Alphaproteobacteria bacterium]|nr:DUF4388 domain-containing protein [Alphaproteobacteria bacterium]
MNAAILAPQVQGGETVMSTRGGRVTLAGLMQLVDMEGVTGWVDVGGHGGVATSDGLVVDAWYQGWHGTDALFELFLACGAMPCVVRETEVSDRSPLGPTSSLVLEACRRADEWGRIAGMRLAVVAKPDAPEPAERARAVMRHLDGTRPLFEAVERAGVPRHAAAHLLVPLIQAGVLVPQGPLATVPPLPSAPKVVVPEPRPQGGQAVVDAAPPVAAGSDFYDWLEQGRMAMRAGDLEGAHACFTEALGMRPGDGVAAQNLRRVERILAERAA